MKKKLTHLIDRIVSNFLLIYVCVFYVTGVGLIFGTPLYFVFDVILGFSLGFIKYVLAVMVFVLLEAAISGED